MAPQYAELVEMLLSAARFGDTEEVEAALEQGADVNSQDEQQRTGAWDFQPRVQATSRAAAARPPPPPLTGPPPPLPPAALHMAAANGHEDVLRRLLEAGADPGLSNAEGNTALHWAALNGASGAASALLAAGASPSALNAHEETPVDAALGRGHQSVVDAINVHARGGAPAEEELDDIEDEGAEVQVGDGGGGGAGGDADEGMAVDAGAGAG
jgi:ankyrin repeat protein